MKEIRKYIVPQYCTQWKMLGILLDLWPSTLDIIAFNNFSDAESCCVEMFSKWLQTDATPTWKKLLEAIEKLKL